ncbi:nucleolar complex protein 4 homolog [Halyomorpha halys]|uniref:nucleolar complex protein 4 homolog n=1 Tax=Halyomorpha halys TaxID=286706 RepID=UPI0006D4FC87|nr:nucleolar complex protein 4 homolog [Halyomorpha halys]XP_014270632.1 nucleolar complex protein 4 homolog [Halyomorpha halys]
MMTIEGLTISFDKSLDECKDDLSKALDKFIKSNTVSSSSIEAVGLVLSNYLKQIEYSIEKREECDFTEWILKWHGDIISRLKELCLNGNEEQIQSAFKTLVQLLPSQIVLDSEGIVFPIQQYADIIKIFISSEDNMSYFLPILKDILIFEDMSRSIWKALSLAVYDLADVLSAKEVMNVLKIINCVEKQKVKDNVNIGPAQSYCKIKDGVLSDKEIELCIKKFWNKIIAVNDLTAKQQQMLLLVLYEQLMPRMTKAVFLTDYFMTSLNKGGPVGLLALQGMFTLIQKHNMNYPDVYKKIYSMLDGYVFDTQYKSRFYYLTDMFLSSSHLPEALVAGYIKKFARLSLIAPPVDIIIMMTFIVNLLIRHPGLKVLMHRITETSDLKEDPYDIEEIDPSLSHAIDSSLWEVKIIQQHVLPSVSSSAMFIQNPLPSVERDLSVLLDLRDDEIFGKEFKKRQKNPPVSFEKPNGLALSIPRNGMNLWCFKNKINS